MTRSVDRCVHNGAGSDACDSRALSQALRRLGNEILEETVPQSLLDALRPRAKAAGRGDDDGEEEQATRRRRRR